MLRIRFIKEQYFRQNCNQSMQPTFQNQKHNGEAAQSQQPRCTIQQLQDHIDRLDEWGITWKIAINAEQSKAMLVRGRRQKTQKTNVQHHHE